MATANNFNDSNTSDENEFHQEIIANKISKFSHLDEENRSQSSDDQVQKKIVIIIKTQKKNI